MIVLASDHAGLELKEMIKSWLTEGKNDVYDAGPRLLDSSDSYVRYAKLGAKKVAENGQNRGIFICGSGVGMNIVANRYRNIRAVLAFDIKIAKTARRHNDCNVLCLGARITGFESAKQIISVFLEQDFEGGRHQTRVADIDN